MQKEEKTFKEKADELDEIVDSITGKEGIFFWEMKLENQPVYFRNSGLEENEIAQIGELLGDFRAAQKAELEDREKRRRAEEEADEVMADFYLKEIKKIMRFRRNQYSPPEETEYDTH